MSLYLFYINRRINVVVNYKPMITHTFQIILISVFAVIFVALISYGLYCKRRAKSYMGTGRVAETCGL
jgi:hypothetical protein